MDLARAAAYYSTTTLDAYNFATNQWDLAAFQGAIKAAPESVTINDLTAKKRMLFLAAGVRSPSSVIRMAASNDIFMVETRQSDIYNDSEYQAVFNLHEVTGVATIYRALPIGPTNDPGWAMNSAYATTFADSVFQRLPMDQVTAIRQYGLYILYFPADCPVQDHDSVNLNGVTYFLFETYRSEGLVSARCTSKADVRKNLVYIVVNPSAYNPATLTPGKSEVAYNVTAEVQPTDFQEIGSDNVVKDSIKVMIDTRWIGVIPKLNDKIVTGGKTYIVKQISQDLVFDQWNIMASV